MEEIIKLKYMNPETGDELPVYNLNCTIEIFREVYFNTPDPRFTQMMIDHMGQTSMLDVPQSHNQLSQFRDGDCFFSKTPEYIMIGRVTGSTTHLVRVSNDSTTFYINSIPQLMDPTKHKYYLLDKAIYRLWIDMFITEFSKKITHNLW